MTLLLYVTWRNLSLGAIKIFLISGGQGNAFCSNSLLSFNACNHWKTPENVSSGKNRPVEGHIVDKQ